MFGKNIIIMCVMFQLIGAHVVWKNDTCIDFYCLDDANKMKQNSGLLGWLFNKCIYVSIV